MLFNTAAVALLAGVASAAPAFPRRNDLASTVAGNKNGTNSSSTPSGDFKSVVYWGQSQNKPLADVCKENVDTVVMAFVNKYGNETKGGEAVANPGWLCLTNGTEQWEKDACSDLGKNVSSCQAAGKKVLMSVGGWIDYSVMKDGDGKKLGESLWEQYAEKGDKNVLGGATLDGFDFDIEHDNSHDKLAGYVEAIKALRSKMGGKSDKIISGAPMCVAADNKGTPNVMTTLMKEGQFDELYFQMYNNPGCSANDADGAAKAWDGWYNELQTGASKGAKMYFGLLGDKGATTLPEYYIDEAKTVSLLNKMRSHKGFAGAMVWDAGYSMNNTQPAGNYLDSVAKGLGRK